MPVITQIADAVVATLNAATLSQPVTATRAYLPRAEVADLKSLKVTVVPSSVVNASVSRSQSQQDVAIDVAIQKKPGNEQNASFDPLLALAEEIGDLFRSKRLESFPLTFPQRASRPSSRRSTLPNTSRTCGPLPAF